MTKKIDFEVHAPKTPVTRRDFLTQGLIGAGAIVSLPTFLGMSARQAIASSALTAFADVTLPELPMVVFDMAGGASMPGNFLVGGAGGSKDLLDKYNLIGWDPKESGALDEQFGIPMSAKASKMLEGILASTSPEARKNFRMGGFCHSAQDDAQTNQLNAAGLVLTAQGPGTKIANGIGLRGSFSGGNSDQTMKSLSSKPTFVTNLNDFLGAVSFGGEPFRGFSLDILRGLAKGSKEMAKVQAEMVSSLPGGDILKDLSGKAFSKGEELIEGAAALDPRTQKMVQDVYGLAANSPVDSDDVLGALVVSATLAGVSGPSTYTIGDCDYHNGDHVQGDMKDRQMGVKIGQAVELAHRSGRPFFFQLLTDGGVEAESGTRNWRGDSGGKCMTVVGFYHPKGAPKMLRTQVGHYSAGQGAESATLIGSSPQLVGCAVFANYLNCVGKLGDFHKFLPETFKEKGQLESVLIFEGAPT